METGPPGVLVIAVVLCALYFLPTWIAGGRNHYKQYAIFASNLLLGWTFLGWVVARLPGASWVPTQPVNPNTENGVVAVEFFAWASQFLHHCGGDVASIHNPR